MKIPYGMSDFEQIRKEGFFYADKTPFLPAMEEVYRHVVFLRPRRFGKSTLLSMLEHYYDLGRRDGWDALFKGLWVHDHPTEERSRYLVLTLDFSGVATDAGEDALRRSFAGSVRTSITTFVLRYGDRIPALAALYPRLANIQDAEELIGTILGIVAATPDKIYLLIDEYDHFANRLLAAGEGSMYETVVKKTGFVRTFYAALKRGTASGALARMFVTGVSPLMLDDLSSGFNIATHASMKLRVHALAGFTRADTERAVDELLASRPDLAALPAIGDRDALLAELEANYNGYRFAEDATERLFNSDLVLYFLRECRDQGKYPRNMLDLNVRTEYSHLQRIGTLSGSLMADRLRLLQTIVSEGHIRTDIVEHFGIPTLDGWKAQFLSLLYFRGMLTIGSSPQTAGGYDLEIPNRVIRELQSDHLAMMLEEERFAPKQRSLKSQPPKSMSPKRLMKPPVTAPRS